MEWRGGKNEWGTEKEGIEKKGKRKAWREGRRHKTWGKERDRDRKRDPDMERDGSRKRSFSSVPAV